MTIINVLLLVIVAIVFYHFGWAKGWRNAHEVVAVECERLGGFFVDDKVYKCTDITPKWKGDK